MLVVYCGMLRMKRIDEDSISADGRAHVSDDLRVLVHAAERSWSCTLALNGRVQSADVRVDFLKTGAKRSGGHSHHSLRWRWHTSLLAPSVNAKRPQMNKLCQQEAMHTLHLDGAKVTSRDYVCGVWWR